MKSEKDNVQSVKTTLTVVGRTLLCVLAIAALNTSADCAWAQARQASSQQSTPELLTTHPPGAGIPIDWIFLIDTSASMSQAESGRPSVITKVKDALHRFISGIHDGDNLTVIVFDTTSRFASADISKTIRSQSDLRAAQQLVDHLSAHGAWTHTGAALKDGLNEVYSRDDKARPAAIILFTDGKEDVRGITNPIRIPDAIKLIPDQDVPFVFYVSLGTELDPDLKKFIEAINRKASDHAWTFDDPHGEDLSTVRAKIEEKIRTVVRRPQPLKFDHNTLDLGTLRPGGRGGGSLDITSPVDATLEVSMSGVPPDHTLTGVPEILVVRRRQKSRIQFSLRLDEGAHEGPEEYTLEFKPLGNPPGLDPATRAVPIKVVVHMSWYQRLWRHLKGISSWTWLLLLLLLLLLVAAAYFGWKWYYQGLTPWEVIQSWCPHQPKSAVLRTPEGPISLDEPLTVLGAEGPKLKKSSASIEIQREGDRHTLSVRNGSVEITSLSENNEVELQSGTRRRLRHLDQVTMPGYLEPLVYHNSFKNSVSRTTRRQ